MKVAMTVDVSDAERELIAFAIDEANRKNKGRRGPRKRKATRKEIRLFYEIAFYAEIDMVAEHRAELRMNFP